LPRAPIFLPSGLATPSVAAGAGPVASRLRISSPALPMRFYGAAGQKFARAFKARFDVGPGPWSIFGYRAMQATIAAIRAAGAQAQDRPAVIQAFFRQRHAPPDPGFGGFVVRAGQLVFDRVL
jgi:ABC-type branched-subunit amino acid transport system substrate-binding protein